MGKKEKKPKYRRIWLKGVTGKLADGASRGRSDRGVEFERGTMSCVGLPTDGLDQMTFEVPFQLNLLYDSAMLLTHFHPTSHTKPFPIQPPAIPSMV